MYFFSLADAQILKRHYETLFIGKSIAPNDESNALVSSVNLREQDGKYSVEAHANIGVNKLWRHAHDMAVAWKLPLPEHVLKAAKLNF